MTTCSLRVRLVGSLVLSACSCCLEVELPLVTERHCRSIKDHWSSPSSFQQKTVLETNVWMLVHFRTESVLLFWVIAAVAKLERCIFKIKLNFVCVSSTIELYSCPSLCVCHVCLYAHLCGAYFECAQLDTRGHWVFSSITIYLSFLIGSLIKLEACHLGYAGQPVSFRSPAVLVPQH